MPASSITRLQTPLRNAALEKISANATAPGGSKRQAVPPGDSRVTPRARRDSLSALANRLGIFAIETRPTGSLAASVGGANGSIASVTLDTNTGTPATTAITTNELDAVTWLGAGEKLITVTVPATLSGRAKVTVPA